MDICKVNLTVDLNDASERLRVTKLANPILNNKKCNVFFGLTRHYTIRRREENMAHFILKLVTG